MAYTPFVWKDGRAGGTQVTAARLNILEQGVAGAATTADTARTEKVNKNEIVINVKDYGGVGDGVAIEDTARDLAIAAAKSSLTYARGACVFFPPGTWNLSTPSILPRTGSTPTNVVTIRGAGTRATLLQGTGSFPTGRAMVEWEASTARAWHQEITDLSMRLPTVSGTRAIHYKRNGTGTTLADFNAERMQITLRDLVLEGNNGYHSSLVKLEGQVFYSKFERIFGDNAVSALLNSYPPITDVDTATLEFETSTYGDLVSSDITGLSYSSIEKCGGGSLRRGGRGVLVRGKIKATTINDGWCDGGRYDAGIDLINSFNVHVRNCNNEGRSAPQIRVKDSQFITIDKLAPSTQDPEFPDWAASTAYTAAVGVVVPGWRTNTTQAAPANNSWYKCTVAGTSGASQPTWPTTIGATVSDGGVTWQCMGASLQDAIIIDGGRHIHFDRSATGPSLPNYSSRGVKMLRLINSPVDVSARRCVTPDNPVSEIAWDTAAGVGEFFGNRNGERVRFGSDPFDTSTQAVAVKAGYYRAPRGSTGTTRAMTQNQEFCVPLDVPAGTVLNRVGINVTTAAAGGTVRLGVRSDSGGYPGALLVDAGTIDASATGASELTISVTTTGVRVWLCAVGQGASTIVCTGINGPVWPVETNTLAAAAAGVQASYVQTGVTGSLGSFGAGNGSAGSAPLIVARTAS